MVFRKVKTALTLGFFLAANVAGVAWFARDSLRNAFDEAAGRAGIQNFQPATTPTPVNENPWTISIGAWEVADGGHHTFLEFGPACRTNKTCTSDNDVYQIHGVGWDTQDKTLAGINLSDRKTIRKYIDNRFLLKVMGSRGDCNTNYFARPRHNDLTVIFKGSRDDVLRHYLEAMKMADSINKNRYYYGLFLQNSNSVARTLTDAMGLRLPPALSPSVVQAGFSHKLTWTPGLDRSLVPSWWWSIKSAFSEKTKELGGDDLRKAADEASPALGSLTPGEIVDSALQTQKRYQPNPCAVR